MCSGWEDSHESGLHYLEDICWLSVQSGQPAKQLHLVPPVALVIVQRTHGRPPQIGVLLYDSYHLVSQYACSNEASFSDLFSVCFSVWPLSCCQSVISNRQPLSRMLPWKRQCKSLISSRTQLPAWLWVSWTAMRLCKHQSMVSSSIHKSLCSHLLDSSRTWVMKRCYTWKTAHWGARNQY